MKRPAIARALLAWYAAGHRDLPWRHTSDPYCIWVSEIMLQQTRAQTAIPYYERFLARFPDVASLAAAGEEEVLALWAGLGYYSRARNLCAAARIAAANRLPRTAAGLRDLPGIGDYTAAAIASIAFREPVVVVDGNVLRVVARLTTDPADIAAPRTRERFRVIAQEWMDRKSPGEFNQALMELGAVICVPRQPRCPECPLMALCQARQQARQHELPVKRAAREATHIHGGLLLAVRAGRLLLVQRPGAGRMRGFWDLPTPDEWPEARMGKHLGQIRHTITHHHFTLDVCAATGRAPAGGTWFDLDALGTIPLATTARKALRLAGLPTE